MKRGKYGKIIFEEKDCQFLIHNYLSMTNKELAKALGVKITSCRTKLYQLGLKRMQLEYWTKDQIQFLKDNYQEMGDVEIAALFNQICPKNKPWSNKHIEKKRRYLKLKRTKAEINNIRERNIDRGCFAIGNKNMWKTRGVADLGTIRIWRHSEGGHFAVVKLKESWVHYNRWLYETFHGDLNSDQLVVTISGKIIADGPEDLEVISRSEHVRRNNSYRLPDDLRQAMNRIAEIKKELINNQ